LASACEAGVISSGGRRRSNVIPTVVSGISLFWMRSRTLRSMPS
jgi:hypothetical protein